MNKDEFLRQLEVLLSGISQEERTEALAFYRSYFEDAGEANEAKILEELESPQKVADSIIKDLGVQAGEAVASGAKGAAQGSPAGAVTGAGWNPATQGAAQGSPAGAGWNPATQGVAQVPLFLQLSQKRLHRRIRLLLHPKLPHETLHKLPLTLRNSLANGTYRFLIGHCSSVHANPLHRCTNLIFQQCCLRFILCICPDVIAQLIFCQNISHIKYDIFHFLSIFR